MWWGRQLRRQFVNGALVVVLAASAALASISPVGGVAGFGDVPEAAFYTEAVQWMVDNEITDGTSATCFSPSDPVTRGQAAAFMWRMEGEPDAPPHAFNDVVMPYQQEAVSWMTDQGITLGTSDVTFSPDDTLTRGQVAAFLWRLEGEPDAPPHAFNDVFASWQQGPVSWMATAEPAITRGTTASTFSPDDPVTRGQLATFFWRYKGEPAVSVDPTHPTDPACAQQVPGPTTTTVPPPPTTTAPPRGSLPYDSDRYFEVTYKGLTYLCEDPLLNLDDSYDCMRYLGGRPPLFFFDPDLYCEGSRTSLTCSEYDPDEYFELTYRGGGYLCRERYTSQQYDCVTYFGGPPPSFFSPDVYCSGPTYSLSCSRDWYPNELEDYEFVTIGFSPYICKYQFFSGDYNCLPYYGGRPPSYFGFPTYVCESNWYGSISSPCIRQ